MTDCVGSILDWMRKTEKRFMSSNTEKKILQKSEKQIDKIQKIENEEHCIPDNLDRFMKKPKSTLFDEQFNQSDFQVFTRQWKERNLLMYSE